MADQGASTTDIVNGGVYSLMKAPDRIIDNYRSGDYEAMGGEFGALGVGAATAAWGARGSMPNVRMGVQLAAEDFAASRTGQMLHGGIQQYGYKMGFTKYAVEPQFGLTNGIGQPFTAPPLGTTQTRTVSLGNNEAIYILDDATALPLQADGLITGPHTGRGKGRLPEPVGGRLPGEHRGHLIPEGGVDNPSFVNNPYNLISEAPSSNLRLKKSLDLQASTLAAENPLSAFRYVAQPMREIGAARPSAVSYYITQDGKLVQAVSVLNR